MFEQFLSAEFSVETLMWKAPTKTKPNQNTMQSFGRVQNLHRFIQKAYQMKKKTSFIL